MNYIINTKKQQYIWQWNFSHICHPSFKQINFVIFFWLFILNLLRFSYLVIIHKMKLQNLYRNIVTIKTNFLCCIILANSKFRSINIFRKIIQYIDSFEMNRNWSCQYLTIIQTSPYNKENPPLVSNHCLFHTHSHGFIGGQK